MTTVRTGLDFLDEPRLRGRIAALAHRGGALHPDVAGLENTVAAFSCALALGFRYLETDARVTRDGVLVAFHDAALDRVTDARGELSRLTAAEVSRARVAGREPIPTLADLLERFPQARFNVDLKSVEAVDPMAALVRRTGTHARLCVGSFDERILRRFRRLVDAPVATSCGVVAATALAAVRSMTPVARWVPAAVADAGRVYQVPVRHRGIRVVDRSFVRSAHASARHVHVWTVNERAEMERLLDLGVDGIITDRTDVLRDVLVGRGLWEEAP